MKIRALLSAVTNSLRAHTAWDFKLALGIALLSASGSALRLSFSLGYNLGAFEFSTMNHRTCCVGFLESYLIPITAGLLLSTTGLWLRNSTGFLLSLLALVWVGAMYVLWHLNTLSLMRAWKIQEFSDLEGESQTLLALYGSNWWDLSVLAASTLLLCWQVKKLINVLPSPRDHRSLLQ